MKKLDLEANSSLFVFLKCDPGERQVRSGNSWTEFVALTQRWLQHVSVPLTGPDRLDVGRVDQSPEVVGVVAAVQTQAQANTHHAHHRRNADRVGVAGVACFKLHTCFEFIGRGDSGLQGEHGRQQKYEISSHRSTTIRKRSTGS